MNLGEVDLLPMQAIPEQYLRTLHELPNEGVYFPGSCSYNLHELEGQIWHPTIEQNAETKINYQYPLVEAQTNAPRLRRIWTQSDLLWRAAKCNGVAPFPSLIFTNLENPLLSNPYQTI